MTEKLFIDREIRCLHCRRHFNVREYQKVELPRQQELIPYILDGSIFEFECPHCREEYTVLKDQEEFIIDNQERNIVFIIVTMNMIVVLNLCKCHMD